MNDDYYCCALCHEHVNNSWTYATLQYISSYFKLKILQFAFCLLVFCRSRDEVLTKR
jgi:hypothetical protein